MSGSFFTYLVALTGWTCLLLFPSPSAEAAGLDALQGRWTMARTNREGVRYTQTVDFAKDKVEVRISTEEGQTRYIATGKVKAEQAGSLQLLVITDIQGGRSEDNLDQIEERRTTVYVLRDDLLYLASNFDKERPNESPRLEIYQRGPAGKATVGTSGTDGAFLGTWKLEVSLNDQSFDYELRIAMVEGKLQGTLISPRSGEHPVSSVALKDGKFHMEVPRQFDGNEVTFVYEGKLRDNQLSGEVAVKGLEEQFHGQWTGRRQ